MEKIESTRSQTHAGDVRRAPERAGLQAELPLEPGADPSPAAAQAREHGAPASAALRWRPLLVGGSPREILGRIVQGDPLRVREHVARRLHADAYLLDGDRVHLRSLARCARQAVRYHGRPELDVWLDGVVAGAIEELLREDLEAARHGASAGGEQSAAFGALARPLGLEPAAMHSACSSFNRLPAPERKAFYELLVLGRSLDLLARESGDSATEIARRARRALDAILPRASGDEAGEDAS